MYIDRVRRNAQDISKGIKNATGSSKVNPAKVNPARDTSGSRGWRGVTQSQPLNITINDTPIGSWRLPDTYRKVATSGSAVEDTAETVLISEVPPQSRSRGPNGTVVKTPHSILPLPLQFLPIVFRHARLFEHAMSVLETLNPAFAARRRQVLCHSGEGFEDPEGAAIAIAVEDKSAPPRESAAMETFVPAGAESAAAAPGPGDNVARRPVAAPVNVHKRRSRWLRTNEATSH